MRLSELLAPHAVDPALGGFDIVGLSADSRTVGADFAFFAVPGHAGDGLDYVADARARGARVIVAERRPPDCEAPLVVVDDVRAALAEWRSSRGLPADPLAAHRASGYAARAAAARLPRKKASGGSYA